MAPVEKMIHIFFPRMMQEKLIYKYHLWNASLQPQTQNRLSEILSKHRDNRAVIVFAPGLDWHRQLFQRPQQLASALAHQGALVFYTQLNPLPGGEKIQRIADRLFLCAIPLEQFSILERFFVYSLTWNRRYLLKFDRPQILYDYLDEVTTFAGDASQLNKDHQDLLETSDVIITTAQKLFEEAKKKRPDALYVPNGVDFSHFNNPTGQDPLPIPKDMSDILQERKPVIGYYGALASWFDYDLLLGIAAERREFNFVIIGMDYDGSLGKSGLLNRPNIVYLGPKSYTDLPAYLAGFDVAILPFKNNKVTQSTSPVKLFEYFAGGKPVVSTPMNEVLRYPVALIGKDCEQFCQKLDEGLALRNDPAFVNRLKQTALENTWNIRAEKILKAIEI